LFSNNFSLDKIDILQALKINNVSYISSFHRNVDSRFCNDLVYYKKDYLDNSFGYVNFFFKYEDKNYALVKTFNNIAKISHNHTIFKSNFDNLTNEFFFFVKNPIYSLKIINIDTILILTKCILIQFNSNITNNDNIYYLTPIKYLNEHD